MGTILRDVFRIEEKPYSVFLFQHQVAWCPQKKGGEDMSEWINVKLKDVLQVEVVCLTEPAKSKNCCLPYSLKKKSGSYPTQRLEITFAQQKKNSPKWQNVTIQLSHGDFNALNTWAQLIQHFLQDFKQRPKNLLFFVNPFGGRRTARYIYEQHVKPVLQLAKVKSTVIETERQNHVTEALTEMSDEELNEFDAVVAVGGDGTLCEVVNGLLRRNVGKADNIITESDLKTSPIPVAVVAAGSTNALAYTLNGTDDPTTGIIHIILGGSLPLDVVAVQNDSGIMRFIAGQMSYGYLADIMLHSEKLRWMGPKRYDYAGFRKFLSHSSYEGSIDIKQPMDTNRRISSQCVGGRGCGDCNSQGTSSTSTEWKRIEGNFIGISAANISLQCPMSPMGMAPFAHLSDGCIELILVRETSRLSHLKYLLRLAGDSRRAYALPFVERYRVKEFVFTPMQCNNNNLKEFIALDDIPRKPQPCKCDLKQQTAHSAWNCDGELLLQSSVRVSIHSNLIRILARNEQDSGSISSSNDLTATTTSSAFHPCTRSPSVLTEEMNTSFMTLESNQSLNEIRF